MNPQIDYGRTLMGDSLGYHILFALLGVGIPFLISLCELIGIVKKDNDYSVMARRWCFALSTLFVIGAISGTIISMQLNALWPTFMTFAGKVIGLPFFLEGFAFFIEAIFLGVYLFTWDKLGKWTHWLCSLPIVFGSVASAFFITTANAWMNNPKGFDYHNGIISNINPIKAMLNPATPTETAHSIFAYYVTTFLAFGGLYAIFLWKEKKNLALQNYYKKVIALTMALGLIFAFGTVLTGDSSGKYLQNYEPLKLAAAENLRQGGNGVDLNILNVPFIQKLQDDFHLHGLLSFFATGNFNGYVRGLDNFNPALWPPLFVHFMFDFMTLIGIFITLVPLLFLIFLWWKKSWAFSRIVLFCLILAGILSAFAVEFGWILTEVGRQPYAIAGIMTTRQAFTTNPNVDQFGYIFPSLYLLLFILTPWVLRKYYKKNPLANELNKIKGT